MKSKLRFHLCFICMLALAVAGCKVKRPNDVIPESKMESLLYDYHWQSPWEITCLTVRTIKSVVY